MTNTPERIWVDFEPRDWPSERIMYGDMPDPYVEYVREDLSTYDAGFAAGIEAAVDRLKKLSGKLDILACEDVLQIADELSALTPSTPPRDGVE